MKQIIVEQNEAGQRLDKLLLKVLNKAPKSFIYKMLRKKNIVLNGRKADGSEKLILEDEIKLFLSDETIANFSETVTPVKVDDNLDIIYEDSNIIIINKPLGILSQKSEKDDVSMVEYVISYLLNTKQLTQEQLKSFKPGVCNRLDRNTSGLLIAGKSLMGLQEMSKLLKDRSLDKYYLCIVKGKFTGKQRVEGYLCKDETKNIVTIYPNQVEGSEYICTEYEPLKYSITDQKEELTVPNQKAGSDVPNQKANVDAQNQKSGSDTPKGIYTLLQVKLVTGRSHQIRAHLASMHYPVIGDFKYGDQKTNYYFKIKYGLTNQLLHSWRMVFPEIKGPLSNLSKKEFSSKEPEIFQKIEKDLFE